LTPQNIEKIGDRISCTGSVRMEPAPGAPYLLNAEIRIPLVFAGGMTVQAFVEPVDGQLGRANKRGGGKARAGRKLPRGRKTLWGIISASIIPGVGRTTLILSSLNHDRGTPAGFDCHYTIIGKSSNSASQCPPYPSGARAAAVL
jgi:hypothetical protein